ncbi:MAG: hypothetical protein HY260_01700 [Chloroflexi bacterium]|nr:hypothetical protein [Chloroflexota bacterium]
MDGGQVETLRRHYGRDERSNAVAHKHRTKSKANRRQLAGAPRRPAVRSPSKIKYPIATIAHYGPDDKTVTKIAVGIIESEDAELIVERWLGSDVMTNSEVQVQIAGFIAAHGAKQVVIAEGMMGCPHEEGIDFPNGEECPYCPFWRGKQGIVVKQETP